LRGSAPSQVTILPDLALGAGGQAGLDNLVGGIPAGVKRVQRQGGNRGPCHAPQVRQLQRPLGRWRPQTMSQRKRPLMNGFRQRWAESSHPRSRFSRAMQWVLFIGITVGGCLSWWQASRGLGAPVRLVGALLFLIGGIFWSVEFSEAGSKSNLGASLLGGAIVALAVLQLQVAQETQRQRLFEQQETDRRRIADRQALQLALGQQRDLSNQDLRGFNLSGFWLRGKKLTRANLQKGLFVMKRGGTYSQR
jgi:hypothetical protein